MVVGEINNPDELPAEFRADVERRAGDTPYDSALKVLREAIMRTGDFQR